MSAPLPVQFLTIAINCRTFSSWCHNSRHSLTDGVDEFCLDTVLGKINEVETKNLVNSQIFDVPESQVSLHSQFSQITSPE